jgi:two-component system LytT family response regulator
VIVDDSEPDRLNLRALLKNVPGVEIVGEAGSLAEAIRLLESTQADILFLDIELGSGQNGFDLLQRSQNRPHVVFTTVHRDYAVEAFQVGAADYIVKPITEDELLRALNRMQSGSSRILPQVSVSRSGGPKHMIVLENIAAVLGDRDYSRVLSGSHEHLDRRGLGEWQQLLADLPFVELDRSTILRLDQVVSWNNYGMGALLTLRNASSPLEIGRTAFRRFRELLAAQ